MRLSDMTIQKLPRPEKGQKPYTDQSVPGFAVRVSQGGTKTFLTVVERERRYVTAKASYFLVRAYELLT
jgi:hypothetical protein